MHDTSDIISKAVNLEEGLLEHDHITVNTTI